jgi:hypothetical protein
MDNACFTRGRWLQWHLDCWHAIHGKAAPFSKGEIDVSHHVELRDLFVPFAIGFDRGGRRTQLFCDGYG